MFDHLMDEVKAINSAWGWSGVFDAIVYIKEHESDYEGTKVLRELRQFMAEGARMFAPKES